MAGDVQQEIEVILASYHMGTLLDMARAAGLEVATGKGNPKKAVVTAALRERFFTRERVLQSLRLLDRRERQVLDRLLLHGGPAPTASFQREIVRAGLATAAPERKSDPVTGYPVNYSYDVPYARGEYVGDPQRTPARIFEDVIARLTWRGLVFSRFAEGYYGEGGPVPRLRCHPADVLYVPEAIRAYLPTPAANDAAAAQPPTVRQGEPALLLRDLYLYWSAVRRRPLSLTQRGAVPKRALQALNATLLAPDPLLPEAETGRLALLRGLLEALGLLHVHRGELRAPGNGLETPEYWGRPQAEQLRAVVQAWVALEGAGELGTEAGRYGPVYAHARAALLGALREITPNTWLDLQDLVERLRSLDLNFLLPEHGRVEGGRSPYYYSSTNGAISGKRSDLLQRFEALEERFVTGCLGGLLLATGLVELGYDGEQLVACRVTPAGHALLQAEAGNEGAPAAPDGARVVVQPSFQLLAMGPVSLAVLAQLDLFAERERAGVGAFEYRLSRESLYRAQRLGLQAAEAIRVLEAASGTPLPQNVRRSLEEWGAQHERITFRTGVSLLQAASPELLAALQEAPGTGPLLARAVAPTVALVARQGEKKLTAALVAQGLFPAVSGTDPQSADHGVVVGDDGAIVPIHAVPSLHLRTRLGRLAEEDGDGVRWHLTPASVRRAGGSRSRVERALQELAALSRGPLPPQVTERVKAWGGYYGEATAQTVTLLEFRDLATLAELREHPVLKGLLTPFPAGERALATVPGKRLPEVKEVLAGLGVPLRDGLSW